ncbi:hypothetical protein Pla108_22240 [Botrimarina colliarenosi]|uniref:Prenyltransferase and squalene oxidase repeat protein n=1 Tax=Botrimarina colliarenosi TaxID=2528001 RepID=A0A5C6AEN1_9BACT|nr:hypothetical protein [Botrimarina colliarenosi]TWT98069.1 hypothetical protein Pla108_22240 [Botrimarina colliarenosi]
MRPSKATPWRLALLAVLACCLAGGESHALLPTSARVRELVDAGVASLEKMAYEGGDYERRLGAKCLVGLALYKAGHTKSPRIREAIEACRSEAGDVARDDTTYSQGLAVIFLTEVAPQRERALIQQYLGMLTRRQMPHGGWGYTGENLGDTSQTQYVALAMWQAHKVGLSIESTEAKGLIDWLSRTQSPEGGWGYKGNVANGSQLIQQAGVTPTLTAAALASLMIGADLHGVLNIGSMAAAGGQGPGGVELPPSVQLASDRTSAAKNLSPRGVDWDRVQAAIKEGEEWMDEADIEATGRYPYYYLYALERYHSFREARTGDTNLEPKWYEQGVDYIEKSQQSPGVWQQGCGTPADTAFAVLFLMRATQKSLRAGIGEGALVSGRGLPKNLAAAKLKRGQVVVEMDPVGVGEFLSMMEKGESDRLDALASDPASLVVGDLSAADTERLTQVLHTGEPGQRLVAARALGHLGDLDLFPALLYGLTDPDPRVALAARDGLRAIARRPRGFGMPDDFNDDQRYAELEQWKRWYLTLRPEAVIDLGR